MVSKENGVDAYIIEWDGNSAALVGLMATKPNRILNGPRTRQRALDRLYPKGPTTPIARAASWPTAKDSAEILYLRPVRLFGSRTTSSANGASGAFNDR